MKKLFLLMVLWMPAVLIAGEKEAVAVLDATVARIKADAGVQMDFKYTVYDADGSLLFADKGAFSMDDNSDGQKEQRYALLLEQMKIWCDGNRQWNYLADTNEIYITPAGSEEAQNFSPIYLMELYKNGYSCSLKEDGGKSVVTLVATDDENEFDEVEVHVDKATSRPVKLLLNMGDNGYTEIAISNYRAGCTFDKMLFVCPIEKFPGVEVIDMMQ